MSTTKCCRDREDPWTALPTKIGRTVHHWWGGAHHPQRCCHSISANHAIVGVVQSSATAAAAAAATCQCQRLSAAEMGRTHGQTRPPRSDGPSIIGRGEPTIISANHAICWRCTIFRRRRRRCRHVSMSTTKCCRDGEDPWTNSPTTIGRLERPSIICGGEPPILSTVVVASAPTTPSGQRSSGSLR
jgi:hypothetical protein